MLNVFIVDDEEDIRLLYEDFLAVYGFNVISSAKDGKEAIEIFKTSNPKPDIILMDYSMPVLNGLEATQEILKIDKEIIIIMMSVDNTIKKLALKSGAKRFLSKDLPIALLVQNLIEIAQQHFN